MLQSATTNKCRLSQSTAPSLPVILLPITTLSLKILLLLYLSSVGNNNVKAVAPTIDYSHNMRILKLPLSTPVGSLIYRLKGSDGDPNTQLIFGVSGISGRALLDVLPVARSWNEADVYLRAPLVEQTSYNLTVFVSDGNMTTQVESTVYPTDDSQQLAAGSSSSGGPPLSPFLNPKHVFHVPENARPDEPIGFVTALESEKSDLPVRFELRGKGADKFSIKYVFGPKGQSRADIVLAQQLDYEKQNLFNLKVLALNAWTNTRFDTRNVAVMDIVVTVGDLQDTPPVFKNLPHLLKLANTLQAGDVVAKIEAEDGDYADQRGVNFALDAASPLSSYFDIDKLSGQVKLVKPLAELAMHAAWDSTTWSQLTVFASEAPDPSSYDRLWPPMYARADIQLVLVDTINLAPRFIGGWQTRDAHSELQLLHGYLLESSNQVSWFTNGTDTGEMLLDNLTKALAGRPSVLDLGVGSNGTFEILLEGTDAANFQVDPNFPVAKQSSFTLLLAPEANRSLFDHEATGMPGKRTFSVDIVARDFGTPQRMSARIRCLIELLDVDDNSPHFEQDLYSFSIFENSQVGQQVGQVRARDLDAGDLGRVRYTALNGVDNQLFALNPENGQITLDGHLDREKKSLYLYLVEARDAAGTGKANYSQVLISVLDVNDNAPVFLQSHYDAVLLADGTFHQPLVVRAMDADESNSANSQVAYEIIAGNQNELFAIDSLSGAIYPSGNAPGDSSKSSNHLPQIPPILNEPIVPFVTSPVSSSSSSGNNHIHPPELAGKILPSHEVEETTFPSSSSSSRRNQNQSLPAATAQLDQQQQQFRYGSQVEPDSSTSYRITSVAPDSFNRNTTSAARMLQVAPAVDPEQLPALDLLLNLESESRLQQVVANNGAVNSLITTRSINGPYGSSSSSHLLQPTPQSALKVPPVTTLIVRAHDFGIPIRSSTVKVNIYNQALLSRSVSVILNGTAEQLEQRREAIERAFSSITGSKANIESIDALSESSSISVARVRLAVPQYSLVDLTDLSALMSAIDYHSHNEQQQQQQWRQPFHYLPSGNGNGPGMSSNITSGAAGNLYNNDVHTFAMDTNNLLERRLLLYIIIVAVCILALLVIWMVYSCNRESQIKIDKTTASNMDNNHYHQSGRYQATTQTEDTSNKTYAKSAAALSTINSPIGNNLAKGQKQQQNEHLLHLQRPSASTVGMSSTMNELMPGTTVAKPEQFSMYNGQVWFEPSGSQVSAARERRRLQDRRASSAPSATSLDSALRSALHPTSDWRQLSSVTPRNASGQFFPNTIGYMENLAALEERSTGNGAQVMLGGGAQPAGGRQRSINQQQQRLARRQRSRKVAPMSLTDSAGGGRINRAFVLQEDQSEELINGEGRRQVNGGRSGNRSTQQIVNRQTSGEASSRASSLGDDESLDDEQVLNSDQELLGFDSTGTPIIATHARPPPPPAPQATKSLVIDVLEPAALADSLAAGAARYLPTTKVLRGGRRASSSTMTQTDADTVAALAEPPPQVQVELDEPQQVVNDYQQREVEKFNEQVVAPSVGRQSRIPSDITVISNNSNKAMLQRQATTEVAPNESSKRNEQQMSVNDAVRDESRSDTPTTAAHSSRSSHSGRGELRKANSQGDLMSELSTRLNGHKRTGTGTGRRLHEQRASVDVAAPSGGEPPSAAATFNQRRQLNNNKQQTGNLSTGSSSTSTTPSTVTAATMDSLTQQQPLKDMKNGELLEKQSIFALTYSGLSSDWRRND